MRQKNAESLTLRERARLLSEAFRADAKAQRKRAKNAEKTFGCLSKKEGDALEEALNWGRRIDSAE